MQLTTYHTLAELQEIRADWNGLAAGNPFLSWEWLVSWWERYGGHQKLWVVACRDDEQRVVGIAPWFVSTSSLWPTIRFLGTGHVCTDYLQIMAVPAHQDAVYRGLADRLAWWSDRTQSGAVELEGLERDCPWHRTFGDLAAGHGFGVQYEPLESSWRVELPTTWDGLLSQMSANGRRKARKAAQRFDGGQLHLRTSAPSDDLEPLWHQFRTLHDRRRESVGDPGCYRDPGFDSFIRMAVGRLVASGQARFQWCETTDGKTIGIQLQMMSADTLYMYQSGIDPQYIDWEPGHAMVYGALRGAIQEGYRTYDFLRGDEPYKALWSAQPVPLARLRLVPPRHAARFFESVRCHAMTARRWARTFLALRR